MDAEERALVAQGATAGGAAQDDGMDMDMDVSDDEGPGRAAAAAAMALEEEEEEGPVRVVKNYQRAAPRGPQQQYDPTK
jgi:hypothetical protein